MTDYTQQKLDHKRDLLFEYCRHRLTVRGNGSPQAVHALADALEEVADVLRKFAPMPPALPSGSNYEPGDAHFDEEYR